MSSVFSLNEIDRAGTNGQRRLSNNGASAEDDHAGPPSTAWPTNSARPSSRDVRRPLSAGLPPRAPQRVPPGSDTTAAIPPQPEQLPGVGAGCAVHTHTTAPSAPTAGEAAVAVAADAPVTGSSKASPLLAPSSSAPLPASPLFLHEARTLVVPLPDGCAATYVSTAPVNQVHVGAGAEAYSNTPEKEPREPIDNMSRFRSLFLGLLVMLMSSTVGAFAIFGFYIQRAYAYTPEDIMNLFVIGTACGLGACFFSGVLYDLYAQRLMAALTGVLMVVPACLLLGLCFEGVLSGSKAQFIGFFFLLNTGAYSLDLVALMTTVTHFPLNRGMVCGLLKTFSGLGASLYSCLYRGYLYNKTPSKNFSNLLFFMTAFSFVLGILCTVFFKPAPWADIRFYRFARRWKAERYVGVSLACIMCWRRSNGASNDDQNEDDIAACEQVTPEAIELHLRRYFAAKLPYLKYRPPQRRTRIAFLLLLIINVYMTLQLVLVTYLEVTSRAALNGIATGAVILVLLMSVLAWPFRFLDEKVDYANAEIDMDEHGEPLHTRQGGSNAADVVPAAENPLDPVVSGANGTTTYGQSPATHITPSTPTKPSHSEKTELSDMRAVGDDQDEAIHSAVMSGGAPLETTARTTAPSSCVSSRRASVCVAPPGANSVPSSRLNRRLSTNHRRTSLSHTDDASPEEAELAATYTMGARSSRTRPRREGPAAPYALATDTSSTMSVLLFAREVAEAATMLEQTTTTTTASPVDAALQPPSSTLRRVGQHGAAAHSVRHGSASQTGPSIGVHQLQAPRNSGCTTAQSSAEETSLLVHSHYTSWMAENEDAAHLDSTQREYFDELMQTVLIEPAPTNRRIPINGGTIMELIKHRSGFLHALLTPELWVLLWVSFSVWATGLTITSNLFIQLIYAAEEGEAMPNNLYYLFAALSGIAIGGGRVAIGTIADDLLPALRRKYHCPFGLPFTLLLVFSSWATVIGLVLFMAIPGGVLQILGQLCISFTYGLTTSMVPYAITVFFSFEYVGLGKMYGLCLAAVGAGVAVLYRAAFTEAYLREAYPVGNPAVPTAAWGMCLTGKMRCSLAFFVACLVCNVVAGFAALYLHVRFKSRMLSAAREQIEIIQRHDPDAEVDVAYLHEWAQKETVLPRGNET